MCGLFIWECDLSQQEWVIGGGKQISRKSQYADTLSGWPPSGHWLTLSPGMSWEDSEYPLEDIRKRLHWPFPHPLTLLVKGSSNHRVLICQHFQFVKMSTSEVIKSLLPWSQRQPTAGSKWFETRSSGKCSQVAPEGSLVKPAGSGPCNNGWITRWG